MDSIVKLIATDAAQIFGTTKEAVLSKSRKTTVMEARQAVQYVLYSIGWTSTRIGRSMGFHHVTILHNRDAVQDRLDVGGQFAAETTELLGKWENHAPDTAPSGKEIYITVNAG